MKFATRAVHAGQAPDPATGATIPPIYMTSTFTQSAPGEHRGFEYSRSGNPTRQSLETLIASLEGGRHGLAFASGLAAETAVLSVLRPGDHVVAAEDLYGGTIRLLREVFGPLGIETSFVDASRVDAVRAAFRPTTRMIWTESPSNPLLAITDIAAVAEVSKRAGALLVVDNTFATPFLQQPLALGADIVVHSTTKYASGHSDVVGGAVVLDSDDVAEKIAFYQNAAGGVPGPMDCWLVVRGLKTLPVRMRAHCQNALAIASFLQEQDIAEKVYYPGLPDHEGHVVADAQMDGYGGMVSVRLSGGREAACSFLRSLRLFSLAESLGGVESLASYPCEMTHASVPVEERVRRGIDGGLVRLSVGIEDAEDLLSDIEQALEVTGRWLKHPVPSRSETDSRE
jgi:cystathionine beta-lyase/cystathionine gamma-synthase